jgi:hypothetical protein
LNKYGFLDEEEEEDRKDRIVDEVFLDSIILKFLVQAHTKEQDVMDVIFHHKKDTDFINLEGF